MVLHLDSQFKPLEDTEIVFESFTFAGGEPHIKINPSFDVTEKITITHRLNSFNDLGLLCIAVDALKNMSANIDTLIIPYFPAARQDRIMITGEPLTVKVYAGIINAMNFKKVIVLDAHSEVTPAVLNNCIVIPNYSFIKNVIELLGSEVILISPDGGALKKIYKTSEYLGGIDVIECSKRRDVKTGKLKNFTVYAENLNGKDCLIVDDICDGGGTFIGLAKALKNKNAGRLFLAISHGIFSKGFDNLQCFEKIFCTNSVKEIENEKVYQIEIKI